MIKGSTVIFNNEYIEEITRHRDLALETWKNELMPEDQEKAKRVLDVWEQKLDWALNFRDTIDRVVNVDIPSITIYKTLQGYELPARHIQIV